MTRKSRPRPRPAAGDMAATAPMSSQPSGPLSHDGGEPEPRAQEERPSHPARIRWAAWDTPDRIAARQDIKNEPGDAQPRLMLITYKNGALKVSATRRPPMMLTDAARMALAMGTWIDGALVSEPDVKLGLIAQTLVKRLRLAGHRYIGGGVFERLVVDDALATLAPIRAIAEPPEAPRPFRPETDIPAFLRKETPVSSQEDVHADSSSGGVVQFSFESLPVRVVPDEHGEPWFVATDVARILDYRNAPDMTRNLDEDEKGTQIVRTPGGPQKTSVISESGLFAAILRSRKPEARKFRKWVTSEVLPSIRKTGSYATPGTGGNCSLTGYRVIDDTIEFRVWRLCNEYLNHTMALMGEIEPEEAVWKATFLMKRKLQQQLIKVAEQHLARKLHPDKVALWLLNWMPQRGGPMALPSNRT